ncbi:MAG: phytanoyl-CoA dioxygenase family protein [Ferruginibacter sp.]
MFRRLKLTYIIYNFFNRKKLLHNVRVYKQLGLKKSYYAPVSSVTFKDLDDQKIPSAPDAQSLAASTLYNSLDDVSKQSLLDFTTQGYAVIRNYLTPGKVEAVNIEIEKLLSEKAVAFTNSNKIMFAFHQSVVLKNLGEDKCLLEVLSSLVQGKVKLFQTINFLMGSEQHTHSDSIHMTTYPLGGLLGVWIALEDIDIDNGPLHYYPGSHLLPYYLNEDYHNAGNFFFLGGKGYAAYEKMIEEKIQEFNLQKTVFTAKKGDVLIWHSNLFHGGEQHSNKNKTRKSMVLHYFADNRVCYHEISQRPALMD